MQIKGTKEIRNYQEDVYFGLSLRQLIFAGLTLLAAVGSYFLLRSILPSEAVSWVCILAAAPFAAFGFVKWHGMQMEQLLPALYRTHVCQKNTLYFRPQNEARQLINEYLKDIKKKEDEDAKNRTGRKSKAS